MPSNQDKPLDRPNEIHMWGHGELYVKSQADAYMDQQEALIASLKEENERLKGGVHFAPVFTLGLDGKLVPVGSGPEPICTCGKPFSQCTRLHDDHCPPKFPAPIEREETT